MGAVPYLPTLVVAAILLRGGRTMPTNDKLSIHMAQSKMDKKPVERLTTLREKRNRSVNYLVVGAILQYLEREEGA